MQLRLVLQPFTEIGRVGAALSEWADDATGLWALTAWAQESGLAHLLPITAGLRARGGRSEAVIGLDQGIATYEGLAAALEMFDDVYLFHDGDRTFHPKLYVIENEAASRMIIGSANATEGGLYSNFEAAVVIDLVRDDPLDSAVRSEARDYFDAFTRDRMPCRRLNAALLQELRQERAIQTTAERRRAEEQRRQRIQPALRRIFGARVEGLPRAPAVARRGRRPAGAGAGAIAAGAGAVGGVAGGTVVVSWWKKLTPSDVMRKPATSHQRKYVILGKARHPIDQKSFFKNHFFAGVAWSQEPMGQRTKELSVVPFDVHIDGRHLGTTNLSVDHADSRVANQNNSPTWLNWSSLRNEILARDFTNWYLLLERLGNGGFRLTLTRAEPGPAIVPPAARV